MNEDPFAIQRKSRIDLGEIYLWTATIHKWIPLLKERIVESIDHVSLYGKIDVFAFVFQLWVRSNRLLVGEAFLVFTDC
jgi:hypothetical protein